MYNENDRKRKLVILLMSIKWPQSLREIMIHYLILTENRNYLFNSTQRDALVRDLIGAYNKLSYQDQANYNVPAKGSFLKEKAISVEIPSIAILLSGLEKYNLAEISLEYKWDEKVIDGFVPGSDRPTYIIKGKRYDKIGRHSGRYLCPILENGEPESYLARAIPYYIPDETNVCSSPAYHVYQANKDFQEENGEYPRIGKISRMFRINPDDGGGEQLVLSEGMCINDLMQPHKEGETECVLTCLK